MDCLTFITKIVDASAWPVAAIVIVFGLREQLQALIPLIRKLKAGPVEVELEDLKKELDGAKAKAASAEAKVEVIAAKLDESEVDAESLPETSSATNVTAKSLLSEVEATVLREMCEGSFATRSITGVAKQSGLTKAVVNATFGSLIAKGLVEQTTNKDGQPRWFVTTLGRSVARET